MRRARFYELYSNYLHSFFYTHNPDAFTQLGAALRFYGVALRHAPTPQAKDKVEALIEQIRRECAGKPRAQAVEKELGYFVRNIKRKQYGTFRAKGYFIGSGVVEAGCKTVIGERCKQSGMVWSEPAAENILALRCIHSSRRLEDSWKRRLNAHAARNDALPLAT